MATANFIYNAHDRVQTISVQITDEPLSQNGNIMELMPLDLDRASLSELLAEAFSRGVNIGRRHPKMHFNTPEHLTPIT